MSALVTSRNQGNELNLEDRYLVDGNAYFFTAVDISRRLEYLNNTRTIIIGIGYPPGRHVYDFRRGPDLTPQAPDYEMPLDRHGKPRTDISFGGAEHFLTFISETIIPAVENDIFPGGNLGSGRRALFGHSYGGIFALNTMYTSPEIFDTYIAASPIVWWNRSFLAREPEAAFLARETPVDPAVSLILGWGSPKSELRRHPGESEASFSRRQGNAEDDSMNEHIEDLIKRLEGCESIRSIQPRRFEGEDHGSVAVTALQHGLMTFLLSSL